MINRLNADIVRVLAMPDVQERFLRMGIETVGSPPEQLSAAIKSEVTRFGKEQEQNPIDERQRFGA